MKRYPAKTPQLWFFEEKDLTEQPPNKSPANDNEKFQALLTSWRHGDKKAWEAMWLLVLELSRKAVSLEVGRKGLHFSKNEKEGFALDATAEIMSRFKKYWGYECRFIVTQVAKAVMHPIYKDKDQDTLERRALDLLNGGLASSWEDVELILQKKVKNEGQNAQPLLPF